jgi:hypothetical protein
MGDSKVDNDHGELFGMFLEEALLPLDAVALFVTDSTAAHSKLVRIQNKDYA